MKKIAVACGTGIATSTVVTMKIKEALEKNNIKADVIQCKVAEIGQYEDNVDLIVTTTSYESKKVPVIRAISFLTGIGMESDIEKIIEILKK
ncbi:MAG: PTS sugar transporter subunit IIB [Eubacteriaceae bacterium]|jgi:PTS system galactitol-specific IIB component|nr:PTS sugar transporter subunit IIB [Eubacteriaceae bacterium]